MGTKLGPHEALSPLGAQHYLPLPKHSPKTIHIDV